MRRDPEELLAAGLDRLGIVLEAEVQGRLLIYLAELAKWNRRINLVARGTTRADMVEKHFLDSLTLLPFLHKRDHILLDVGTGAGFPGLVLAAAQPDLQVRLVEPRGKRVSFLRHVIRTLSLANAEVFDCRIEELPRSAGQGVDLVTSRAVADPAVFLAMVAPFLAAGASALLMMGPEQGLPDPEEQCRITVEEKRSWKLPFSGGERIVIRAGAGGQDQARL